MVIHTCHLFHLVIRSVNGLIVTCSVSSDYPSQSWIIVHWTFGNSIKWNSDRNIKVCLSQKNGFENVVFKMAATCYGLHSWNNDLFLFQIHTEAIQNEAETNLLKLICDTYQVSAFFCFKNPWVLFTRPTGHIARQPLPRILSLVTCNVKRVSTTYLKIGHP